MDIFLLQDVSFLCGNFIFEPMFTLLEQLLFEILFKTLTVQTHGQDLKRYSLHLQAIIYVKGKWTTRSRGERDSLSCTHGHIQLPFQEAFLRCIGDLRFLKKTKKYRLQSYVLSTACKHKALGNMHSL